MFVIIYFANKKNDKNRKTYAMMAFNYSYISFKCQQAMRFLKCLITAGDLTSRSCLPKSHGQVTTGRIRMGGSKLPSAIWVHKNCFILHSNKAKMQKKIQKSKPPFLGKMEHL